MGVLDVVNAGVLTGSEAKKLFAYAKKEGFAIPAVNVVGTDSINAVLEAASKVKSPVIVQFSNGVAVEVHVPYLRGNYRLGQYLATPPQQQLQQ